jgi:hypothetical protein
MPCARQITNDAGCLASFEVDAPVDRQAGQVAAQAIQPALDRAGAHSESRRP